MRRERAQEVEMAPQQRKSWSIGGTNFQRVNAAAAGGRWIVLLLLAVALLALDVQLQSVQGANYTVGDQFGWSLPEANGFNSSYYNDEWLTTLVLYPADMLFFNYKVPAHSVLQVSEIDYISCNYNSPLNKYMSGADSVGPLSAGMSWFICGTPSHCSIGMRMAVPVEAKPSLGPPFQLVPPPAPTPPGPSTGTTPPGPMSGDAASSLRRTTSGILLSPQSFLILAAALHVLLYS